jgi:glycosyltransferase involved in cell wall biosynthesis
MMDIHFDGVNFAATKTGPNGFALELAKQFVNMGHNIVDSGSSSDVSLVFIEKSQNNLGKKIVQRLDGIWSKPSEVQTRNLGIRSTYNQANAVIFQSQFDKTLIESLWGKKDCTATILNGVAIKPVTEFTIESLLQIRSGYEFIFVCSANWHRQKRLRENIECFKHIRSTTKKSCCLIVLGANPDYNYADKDVFYTGSVPSDIFMQIYSMANYMLHLAWRDHCPNTVVHCLSQMTPVICTDDGGTCELVDKFGIVLKEKMTECTQPFDYENPPTLDFQGIDWLKQFELVKSAKPIDVSIETCAKKYISLFERIL